MPVFTPLRSGLVRLVVLLWAGFLLGANVSLFSQTAENTMRRSLLELAEEYQRVFVSEKAAALRKADSLGLVVRREQADGRIMELMRFVNGHPMYYTTYNAEGAGVISSSALYHGGSAGLSLSGAGQTLGIWDGGRVRVTHQEFNDQATPRVIQQDNTSGLSNHATHVAGTMVAGGLTAQARGMSPGAMMHAWDWNDDASEMASAAAAGLKVSQHSYGYITGWNYDSQSSAWYWYGDATVSSEEDYYFGFYSVWARLWDEIAHSAPYYLIVKSAGNDRGQGPAEGTQHYYWHNGAWTSSTAVRQRDGGADGYDCISHNGVSKNILSVGAVLADGSMSSFSGWGPSDDGRVKPDVVAKGVMVYSSGSGSNDQYVYMSGTSMSGPMVSGSIGLLLEHQENLHPAQPLLSSSMKALVLHTADDMISGAPGPDYRYGWGMMNTAGAAQLMSLNALDPGLHIREMVLNQGQQLEIPLRASGDSPLRITMVWNDVPGTPPPASLNPTSLMLVNDLDMRLASPVKKEQAYFSATKTTYEPYILDPANPALPATTGDNFRDNVEMIHLESVAAGEVYTLTISHKGSLAGGSQSFSLIVSGNMSMSGISNPQAFQAEAISPTDISLSWETNLSDDEVLLLWSSDGLFGTPVDGTQYSSGQSLPGGGTVLLSGNHSSFIHTALDQASVYYYRLFAFNTSFTYSSGVSAQAVTACAPIAELPFYENFDASANLPLCWEIVDHQGNGQIWQIGTHDDGLLGTSGNYAFLNSDAYGYDNTQHSDLITPEFDLSNYTDIQLSFTHFFQQYLDVSSAGLYYISDDSGGWQLIEQWLSTTANPAYYSVSLPGLSGKTGVRFKWKYSGSWGWFWDIDDVEISGTLSSTLIPLSLSADDPAQGEVRIASGSPGATASGSFLPGQSVSITALPFVGYSFTHWSGDTEYMDDPALASAIVTMPASAVNLTAHFALLSYEITAEALPEEGGDVTGAGTYAHGSMVTLTAEPALGYVFLYWTEGSAAGEVVQDGGSPAGAVYSFTAEEERHLVAHFGLDVFTLSLFADPPEGGSVEGGGSYNPGEEIPVVADPAVGYSFTHWSGNTEYMNDPSLASAIVTMPASAVNLTAHFALLSYEITAEALPEEGGEVMGAGTYVHGSVVTLTAEPALGYAFLYWTEGSAAGPVVQDGGSPAGAVYSFPAEEERHLVAHFGLDVFTLSLFADPSEGGSVSGGGTYTYLAEVEVSATPAPGYYFTHWSGDTEYMDNPALASAIVTMPASAVNLTAHFALLSYEITAEALPEEGGEVMGAGTYAHGSMVTLAAEPALGYVFLYWTEGSAAGEVVQDGGSPAGSVYSFPAEEERHLVAHFGLDVFTLSLFADPSEGGSVSGGGTYSYMEEAEVSATAAPGYYFTHWSGDIYYMDEPGLSLTTVTMPASAVNLTAHFALLSYEITAEALPEEGGEVMGAGTYAHGSMVTLAAEPALGYVFLYWTEGSAAGEVVQDGSSPAGAVYSFTAEEERHLVAHFGLDVFTLSLFAEPAEGGSVSGGGTYSYLAEAEVSATAAPGYYFTHWSGDIYYMDEPGLSLATVTMPAANINLNAHFALFSYNITAEALPEEGGEVMGAGTYAHGSMVTLAAEPALGYVFLYWTEGSAAGEVVQDGSSPAGAVYSFTAEEERHLVAHFGLDVFTLSLFADPAEGGSVEGGGFYNPGEEVPVLADPAVGYSFTHWSGDTEYLNDPALASAMVTMPASDISLTAHFALLSYGITAESLPEEGGDVIGAGSYVYGSMVTLTAEPALGYVFLYWTEGSAAGTVVQDGGSPSGAVYSFPAEEERHLVAHFGLDVFTLSLFADPAEGGSVEGGGFYNPGEEVPVLADPAVGYSFTHWSGDTEYLNDPALASAMVTMPASDISLTAHFALLSYGITAESLPEEGGDVIGAGSYVHGSMVTLTAEPALGYAFLYWTEGSAAGPVVQDGGSPAGAVYSFPAEEERHLVAHFGLDMFSVSLFADPTEGGSVEGSGAYTMGELVEIIANPALGYYYTHWSGDTQHLNDTEANPAMLTMPALDVSLTAHFALLSYEITAEALPEEGGLVLGTGSYVHGSMVTLTAEPALGYAFLHWTEGSAAGPIVQDGGSPAGATYSFVAEEERHLVAHFGFDMFTVSLFAEPAEGGLVSGGGAYDFQAEVEVSAIPATGYYFTHWSGDTQHLNDAEANPAMLTMPALDVSLTAHFELLSYEITTESLPEEGGEVMGTGSYVHGSIVTLTAEPALGYAFLHWTEGSAAGAVVQDGGSPAGATYSFVAEEERHLVAHFGFDMFTVSLFAEPAEGGLVSGGGAYDFQAEVEVSAIPATGYYFTHWSGDTQHLNDAEANPAILTMPAIDVSLTAHFALLSYGITAESLPEEGGDVIGAGSYVYGSMVTLTAEPALGYVFLYWTEGSAAGAVVQDGGSPTGAVYSFPAEEERHLVAHFGLDMFTLSLFADPTEGGSVEGSGAFSMGEQVGISATPALGYYFTHWSGDTQHLNDAEANPAMLTMPASDVSLTAHFALLSYEITAEALPEEGGLVLGTGSYVHGSMVTLTAEPALGYAFLHWTEGSAAGAVVQDGGSPSGAIYSFVAEEERHLVAHFGLDMFTVSLFADPTEGGSLEGSGAYTMGELVEVSATPAPGYYFTHWSGDTQHLNDAEANPAMLTMPASDVSLTAHFALLSYEITAEALPEEGGLVLGTGSYVHGSMVTLTAEPALGYAFLHWTEGSAAGAVVQDGGSPTGAVYSFPAEEERHLVAHFGLDMFTLSLFADPTEGGSVEGSGAFSMGEQVGISATPALGYYFTHWSGDTQHLNDTEANPAMLTMPALDVSLTAHFELLSYEITTESLPEEGGEVMGTGSYVHGSMVTLTAEPALGYVFLYWTEGSAAGEVVQDGGSPAGAVYSFVAEEERHLVAHFGLDMFTVSLFADPTEGGSLEGSGANTMGELVEINATPALGYYFTHWSGDTQHLNDAEANPAILTMPASDVSLTAHFELLSYEITTESLPEEGGEVMGTGSYVHGSIVTLTAEPSLGYAFLHWTEGSAAGAVVQNGGSPSGAIYSFVAEEERHLVAHFGFDMFTVSLFAEPAEGGLVSGGGAYDFQAEVEVSATPAPGYYFTHWSGDTQHLNNPEANPAILTMPAIDVSLTAHFAQFEYAITAEALPEEGGLVLGAGSYVHGSMVTLTAEPALGYAFLHWTEGTAAGEVVQDGGSPAGAVYSFVAEEERHLVAHFGFDMFTVSLFADPTEGGSLEGSGAYTMGELVEIIANPAPGYYFTHWSGDTQHLNNAEANPAMLTMPATDVSLTAHFAQFEYAITAEALPEEGGLVMGVGTYVHGSMVTLTAEPALGYAFLLWTEGSAAGAVVQNGGSPAGAVYSFVAEEDRHLVAHFGLELFSVSLFADPTEGGSVEGSGAYTMGELVEIIANPAPGYYFTHWSGDTQHLNNAEANPAMLTMPATDVSLTAHFAQFEYAITAEALPEEGGLVMGVGTYVHGSMVTLTAEPALGYGFLYWTEGTAAGEVVQDGGSPAGAEYSFPAEEERHLVAHFVLVTYAIEFLIVDAIDEEPLGQALISLFRGEGSASGYSGPDGRFVFVGVLPGIYSYTVERDGYFALGGQLELSHEDLFLTVDLTPDDTGLTEQGKDPELLLYPNPAGSWIKIELAGSSAEHAFFGDHLDVQVFSQSGQRLHRSSWHAESDRVHEIHTGHLPPGVYMLRLTGLNQQGVLTRLFVVK